MAWMTKGLALDLLAILIGAATSASNRIKDEPEPENWPPAEETKPPAVAEQPAAPADTPPETTAPQPAPAPEVDVDALLIEAKNLLQPISRNGGRDWIKNTLLPQFGAAKLSDVPADKLPDLIKVAKEKAADQ
ncbi:hypothetical protein [uncultured Corynebacterium sp.]|uniref:hypothetical protein n=1 Tax=uncultured Corynebacterium sp. TaxID=159447 RepID=UPI002593F6BD|nr:hypothetical protein [uncultured Corynebacterium sp.]